MWREQRRVHSKPDGSSKEVHFIHEYLLSLQWARTLLHSGATKTQVHSFCLARFHYGKENSM